MKKTKDVKTIAEAFAEFLKTYHCGEANAIKAVDINKRFPLTPRQIREVVNRLRCEGVPICSGSMGYYYASNSTELARTKKYIVAQANAMLAAANAMSTEELSC